MDKAKVGVGKNDRKRLDNPSASLSLLQYEQFIQVVFQGQFIAPTVYMG
jgi:hypothetical protein